MDQIFYHKKLNKQKEWNLIDWYNHYREDIDNIYDIVTTNKKNNKLFDDEDIYKNLIIFLYDNSTKIKYKNNF